mgnify:CR=1 FL=1
MRTIIVDVTTPLKEFAKKLLPPNWLFPRLFAVTLVSLLYIGLGIAWLYIGPRPELIPEFSGIRPWVWILTGAFGLWVSHNHRYSVHAVGVMGGLAVERIVVLLITTVRGDEPFGWYLVLLYLALWFASCFANYIPEKRVHVS